MGASWIGSSTPRTLVKRIQGIQRRAQDGRPITQAWGRRMAQQSIPNAVMAGGQPKKYPPVWRFGAWAPTPLVDLGTMLNGISYAFGRTEAIVATEPSVKAYTLHYGKTIYGKPWLAIPQSPPLTPDEARTRSPRSFRTAFILGTKATPAPQGPGLYRKLPAVRGAKGRMVSAYNPSTGAGVELIFKFVRKVVIKPRPFMVVQDNDRQFLHDTAPGYVFRGEK